MIEDSTLHRKKNQIFTNISMMAFMTENSQILNAVNLVIPYIFILLGSYLIAFSIFISSFLLGKCSEASKISSMLPHIHCFHIIKN